MRPAKGEGRVGQDAALSEIQEATPGTRLGIFAGFGDLPQFLAHQAAMARQRRLIEMLRQPHVEVLQRSARSGGFHIRVTGSGGPKVPFLLPTVRASRTLH